MRGRPTRCAPPRSIDRVMITNDPAPPDGAAQDAAVDHIVRAGAGGAVAVAGIATVIVFAIWLLFYLLVFVPRTVAP
jgi:hypothetical protein